MNVTHSSPTPKNFSNAPTGNLIDDFDGDGVPNAIKFVLGGSQDTSDFDNLPVVAASGDDITFTFMRDRDSVDACVCVEIEAGTDLMNWPTTCTVLGGGRVNYPKASARRTSSSAAWLTASLKSWRSRGW